MARVSLSMPVTGISGRLGGSEIVCYAAKGGCYARAAGETRDPVTAQQRIVRGIVTRGAQGWGELTHGQRAAWGAYAERHFKRALGGLAGELSGAQVFNKVAFMRLAQGLEMPTEAPEGGPPPRLRGMTAVEEAGQGEQVFAFRVLHDQTALTGVRLLARVARARSAGRVPRAKDARYIAGLGEGSFAALPASGGVARFEAQRGIEAGAAYGIELTVVSAEGVPGERAWGVFVRGVD